MRNTINKLAMLFCLSVLFACGGGGGGGGSSESTPPPPVSDAVADAGGDQDVNRIEMVTLDGSGSYDPDNAALSYRWTQVYGPDVTGGSGNLTGVSPSFSAPDEVSTLVFELRVNDGVDSSPDTVQVNVMEEVSLALFVDGDNGSDANGVGSRANPFASIRHALSQVSFPRKDIYVKTLDNDASYDETSGPLAIYSGTSLYGGYDENWVRDVTTNKTIIAGSWQAVMIYFGESDIWLSGFDISARNSLFAHTDVEVVRIDDFPLELATARLVIRDNILSAGNAGAGTARTPGGSFGIHSLYHPDLEISSNTIITGRGGDGADGDNGVDGVAGGDGGDALGRSTGVAGINTVDGRLSGGRGGVGALYNFANLPPFSGCFIMASATAGEGEAGGAADFGGDGGNGVDAIVAGTDASIAGGGDGDYSSGSLLPAHGQAGGDGQPGSSGSGGGGGNGGSVLPVDGPEDCFDGGGGGGGGAAASEGRRGGAGSGGGVSVAIYVSTTGNDQLAITGNSLQSGDGGNAGRGGNGGNAAYGGAGGSGAIVVVGTSGGNGGRGGNSTAGGDGSGGGGGPSYGIFHLGNINSGLIDGNDITSGNGGVGGDSRNGQAGSGGYSYGMFIDHQNIVIGTGNSYLPGNGGAGGVVNGTGSDGSPGQTGEVLTD